MIQIPLKLLETYRNWVKELAFCSHLTNAVILVQLDLLNLSQSDAKWHLIIPWFKHLDSNNHPQLVPPNLDKLLFGDLLHSFCHNEIWNPFISSELGIDSQVIIALSHHFVGSILSHVIQKVFLRFFNTHCLNPILETISSNPISVLLDSSLNLSFLKELNLSERF
jgi:hypothetical protein